MHNNYKIIFGLRILKSIIGLFIDTFFVLYFLTLSNDNIFPLSMYYIVVYCTIFLTAFLLRNVCKSRKRIYLFRVGILFNLIYFLCIYIMKENLLQHILLIGILYGLEEGMYYSVYNNLESFGVCNSQRQRFLGLYTMTSSLVKVFIPLLFGSLMDVSGFEQCIILVLILIIFQLILSVLFKDKFEEHGHTNLKNFIDVVKESNIVQKVYKSSFLNGMTYSGAFNCIITIYIVRTVHNGISLGIFNSFFGIVTSLVGLFFAKWVKLSNYKIHLKIASLLAIVGLLCIMIRCNFVTVVIFNLFQVYSKTMISSINEKFLFNTSNLDKIKSKYKVEYFLGHEFFIFIGRVTSYLLLMLLAIWDTIIGTNIILCIFGMLIIIFSDSLTKLKQNFD